jgi:hypothetical protein
MRSTSTTTKLTARPYSREELHTIAAQIEEYRRSFREEYAWEDHEGRIHVADRMLPPVHNEQLHIMAKEIFQYGSSKQKGKASTTLQVIGQTICKEDPR